MNPFRHVAHLLRLGCLVGVAACVALPSLSWAAQDDHGARLSAGARMLEARSTFQSRCAGCHGQTGEGVGGTIDFTSPAAVANLSREAMVRALRQGHDASVRSAWSADLTDEKAEAIIDYIREAFMLPAPVADASAGRAIYAKSCSVCHGEHGDGASWAKNSLNPSPRSFTGTDPRKLTRQDMIRSVTYGRNGTAMMPFATQYSRDEIVAVVDYVRGTFMHAAPLTESALAEDQSATSAAQKDADRDEKEEDEHDEAAADMSLAFPSGLRGDPEKGRTFFEGNCAECHGAAGDGKGRRAYFMRHKPENFTSDEARTELNRPHLFEAIAKGVRQTEMPAWSKVLNAQQIADVAEYVFVAFVANGPKPPAVEPHGQIEWRPLKEDGDGKKN